MTTPSSNAGQIAERTCAYYLGAEVDPLLIRAGVFSAGGTLIGKTKFSTKSERGAAGVIPRIEKCLRYAVDECDLEMDEIAAIGIGVPGLIGESNGVVIRAPHLAWQNIALRQQLEDALGRPVAIANSHNLGAFGVHAKEGKASALSLGAIFLGPLITGGLIVRGQWQALDARVTAAGLGAMPDYNVLATVNRPEFEQFRSKDFRKAIRQGNERVRDYVRQIAFKAGEAAAWLMQGAAPEMIAIGGGMLEEMKEELLHLVREGAARELNAPWPETTRLIASGLGDLAAITGAALWSASRHAPQANATALAS